MPSTWHPRSDAVGHDNECTDGSEAGPPCGVGPPFSHDLPKRLARAIGSRPPERGN